MGKRALMSDQDLFDALTVSDEGLPDLIARSRDALEAAHGPTRTYVVNRNVNYTDACEYHCTFCGFKERVGDPTALTLSVADIVAELSTPYAAGVTETTITGGLNPAITLDFYLDLVATLRATYPDLHLHAFSPDEFDWLSTKSGRSIPWLISAFKERGLNSAPGTAAEILDDEIRRKICPEKVTTAEWDAIIRECHRQGIPTTATILLGHLEGPEHQVRHLRRIRDIALETGGITEFIPLPFVPYDTPLKKKVPDMRALNRTRAFYAAARLYFAGVVDHVQVSWVKLGPDVATELMTFATDDLGGTLLEENITRKAGGCNGTAQLESDLLRLIRGAGGTAARRTTFYNRLPVGLMDESMFAAPAAAA